MVTKITLMPEDPQDWLHNAKDDNLACRGQGHNWPKLRNGKTPRGIRWRKSPEVQGQVEITFTCRDCGTSRRIITGRNGLVEFPTHYSYDYPEGYAAPKGTKVTRRMAFIESNRRWLEDHEEVTTEELLDAMIPELASDEALNALRRKLLGELT